MHATSSLTILAGAFADAIDFDSVATFDSSPMEVIATSSDHESLPSSPTVFEDEDVDSSSVMSENEIHVDCDSGSPMDATNHSMATS